MNFLLIGLGYISDKHLNAIKTIGGNLVAAYDPYSAVGKLDSYFENVKFFNDLCLLDHFLESVKVDYVVICSPNYTHYFWIKYALSINAAVICEKPIVINKNEYNRLLKCDFTSIYPILQLRNNEEIKKFKQRSNGKKYDVEIVYTTFRGDWYNHTWQLKTEKSGGLKYNIGIHLFDILTYLFGECKSVPYRLYQKRKLQCKLMFDKADVDVHLEIGRFGTKRSHRIMKINEKEIDMTQNFADLHTECYKKIIAGKWFNIKDIQNTMNLIDMIGEIND